MILDNIFTDFIFAAISSFGFAILFNAPRKKIHLCAINGGIGWVIYILFSNTLDNLYIGIFLGSIFVSAFSRILSHRHDMPYSLFFVPAIMPLVPGANMLNTMTGILEGDMFYAYDQAVTAILLAGIIMGAFIFIYMLPPKFFLFKQNKSNDIFK